MTGEVRYVLADCLPRLVPLPRVRGPGERRATGAALPELDVEHPL